LSQVSVARIDWALESISHIPCQPKSRRLIVGVLE